MRVDRRDTHGNAIDFTGLLQIGETLRCVKDNLVDELHVIERSNEDASTDLYERSEINVSGIC